MVKRVLEAFCQLLRIAVGVLIAVLIVPVAMQVVARYTGLIPVYLWTEELATFIFVWIVMLGSMIAVWEGTHFDVHVIPCAKSPLGKLLQQGFVLSMISVFAILFTYFGVGYAKFGSIQQSVMMQVNLLVTYITVPVAGVGWAVFALYRLWELILEYRRDGGVAA
ncbi:TRAP transporter small permease subunit [Rhodobacteraceae bacterium NNCM2]|nr:TRAP transporter small permease subunit [Coraliihabitans acroporae]